MGITFLLGPFFLKEGQSLLGDEDLERTRAQTAACKNADESPQKPKIIRDSTMAVTAQVNAAVVPM